ncbi:MULTISPECIES: hypothetical protein [Gimesia]|jgi:RNase P/RNase MRP subunit p30|uniref:Uncharacterized protein n=2 Tax=Gimesia TaxID=1649453 RepID=A0A517VCV2_9PLAN|nr:MULTISPECIES: hypothetical protein [Gimesia]MAC53687.1 transcriptional regulator [Gimesia sp.]EDL59455.1 hypothetical protein PM8797T_03850 [Gimesia maris DSM 8797]QDT77606.1 hypothetical protein Mal35_10330 [Gimesia maris]QDT90832.1 hypothetical protein Pan161_24860 [Gimesia algae]QDU13260.1 hypothetical protein CA11_10420 [Gimesia maris]|tara:strand:+ start:58833 stop:59111 length:279 start_codon:yes stop_codon:yes gene_type:complete
MNIRLTDETDSASLPREVIDLGKKIAELPREQQQLLEVSYSRVVESVKRRRRILGLIQEALAQLRLDVKYLMFDLDITKKERDELKARLEET